MLAGRVAQRVLGFLWRGHVSSLLIFFIKTADVEPDEEIHARVSFKNNRFWCAGLAF